MCYIGKELQEAKEEYWLLNWSVQSSTAKWEELSALLKMKAHYLEKMRKFSLSTRRNRNPCPRKILDFHWSMSLGSGFAMEMPKIMCTMHGQGLKEIFFSV